MTEKQRKQYEIIHQKANEKYIGKKYGRLTVLKYTETVKKHKYFLCICDCGVKKIVDIKHLTMGHTRSCGCLWQDEKHEYRKIHGFTKKENLYSVWCGMKHRCYCKTCKAYKYYGDRGILVCDEWKNSYLNFRNWAIKNGYKENLTIDRINVNGNYEPSNCRWVSDKVQSRNKRSNVILTFNGISHCIVEWSEILNIPASTLNARLNKLNWSVEKTLTEPLHSNKLKN